MTMSVGIKNIGIEDCLADEVISAEDQTWFIVAVNYNDPAFA